MCENILFKRIRIGLHRRRKNPVEKTEFEGHGKEVFAKNKGKHLAYITFFCSSRHYVLDQMVLFLSVILKQCLKYFIEYVSVPACPTLIDSSSTRKVYNFSDVVYIHM